MRPLGPIGAQWGTRGQWGSWAKGAHGAHGAHGPWPSANFGPVPGALQSSQSLGLYFWYLFASVLFFFLSERADGHSKSHGHKYYIYIYIYIYICYESIGVLNLEI